MHMCKSVLSLFLLLGLFVSPAFADTGSLDQVFEPNDPNSGTTFSIRNQTNLETQSAQSFTVGTAGVLSCVEVYVQRVLAEPNPLILEIQTLVGGVPSGVVLASAVLAPASVPTTLGFVAFDVSGDGMTVAVGEQYAIVLRADLLPINDVQWYNWEGEFGANATYAGGNAFIKIDADPWTVSSSDLCFRTYVTAAVPVEPATWGRIKQQFQTR